MPHVDADHVARRAELAGLVSADEVMDARQDADDGSPDALLRAMLGKNYLTRWQVEKLKKNEPGGFFYGGCKVLFHIAEGTFARVYRGARVFGGQSVAIKVLRSRFNGDPVSVRQFHDEAEAGLRLPHPNIVRMLEYGQEDGKAYMIMEFVEGSNLRDFLKIHGRLSEAEALPMLLGLVSALKFSHERGIAHRDLKGTNILIASNGTAKLVDFGLATTEGDDKTVASTHGQRTVDYSALERSCGSPKGDFRSDIFFLGCVFYQMLTGQLPMPEVETSDPLAKMLKRGINSIKPLHENPYAPSADLTRIIEKMMKVDLRSRYATFDEVERDLKSSLVPHAPETVEPVPEIDLSDLFLSPETETIMPGEEVVPLPSDPPPTPPPAAPESVPEIDLTDFFLAPESETMIPGEMAVVVPPERKSILCVEYQDEIREAFRKSLAKMGHRVLLVSNAEIAAERYAESLPDAVVFDLDGLGPDGLTWFHAIHESSVETGHPLLAVVLLGPRQADLARSLPPSDQLVVLNKPIKMKQVQDALAKLLPTRD